MLKSRSKQRNAATQTHDMDSVLEIAHLQEQVKLLTIENDHLRKYISGEPSATLETISPIIDPHYNDTAKIPKAIEPKQTILKSQNTKKRNSLIRGCNCKKNCTSKLCGCGKKNMRCGEQCKCNNCQNREINLEENEKHLENKEVVQMEDKQITNKNFKNVIVHKNLFSPDTIQTLTPNLEKYKLPALYFESSKRLTFKYDEEDKIEEEIKEKPEYSKRRGRAEKNNLKVDNTHTQKQRSVSNEEKRSSEGRKTEEHILKRSCSNEIGISTDNVLKDINKRTNNYFQNIEQGMVTLRCHKKKKNLNLDKQSQESSNAISDSKKEIRDVSMENNKKKVSQYLSNKTSKSVTQEKIELSNTEEHNNSGLQEIPNNNFNPMKPRHEIPRTPISGNSSRKEEEEFVISEEFNKAEVDWEKYQAQLITCNSCERKFHPYRIKKHQSCCKKL